jgi:hypothetical protein
VRREAGGDGGTVPARRDEAVSGSRRRAGGRTTRQLVSDGAGVLRPQTHGDVNPGAGASVPPRVIGIGAGGTRNRAVLADAVDGGVLGEGVAGPGNALTVPPPSADHPAEAVARAVPEAIPRAATPSSACPAAARSAPCPRSPG